MKIIINKTENDYDPIASGLQTLRDLIAGLTQTLNARGYVRFGFVVDGKPLVTLENWKSKKVEEILCVEVDAIMALDLDKCVAELEGLQQAIENQDKQLLQEIDDRWDETSSSILFWLSDFHIDEESLNKLSSYDIMENPKTETEKMVACFLTFLKEKEQELGNPVKVLAQTLGKLQDFKSHLVTLSSLFTQGADKVAMDIMLGFSVTLHKFSRCANYLDERQEELYRQCVQFSDELTTQLNAFSDAYANKDYVLAGDIAEYELADRLLLLDKLKEQLPKGEV